jgi:hypothetical protein
MTVELSGWYILLGRLPVPCRELTVWARWMMTSDGEASVVKQEHVGEAWVSTVFLGRAQFGSDPDTPLLFETMIFGLDETPRHQERCATWDDAEVMHERAVAIAKEAVAAPK